MAGAEGDKPVNYLIGIDLGTSGTKTVLFDQNGAAIASATVEYPLYQPKNGWAEQAPSDWWQAAAATVRRVIDESGVAPEAIKGVGLSGQMHGLVMLDEAGEPLRRSIIGATGEPRRSVRRSLRLLAASGSLRLLRIRRLQDSPPVRSCGSAVMNQNCTPNADIFCCQRTTYVIS